MSSTNGQQSLSNDGRSGRLQSVFGALGSGFILFAVFVAGMWFLVIRRALENADGDWGKAAGPILVVLVPAFVVLLAIYTGAMIWVRRSFVRNRNLLLAQPDAIVLASGRVPQLIRGLQETGYEEEFGLTARNLPYGFSLVANSTGVELWAGASSTPREYFSVPWSDVIEVDPVDIPELGRSSRGLQLTVRSKDDRGLVALPFVILGRGIGGLFPESQTVLSYRAAQLLDLKHRAPGNE